VNYRPANRTLRKALALRVSSFTSRQKCVMRFRLLFEGDLQRHNLSPTRFNLPQQAPEISEKALAVLESVEVYRTRSASTSIITSIKVGVRDVPLVVMQKFSRR
jgi:hypothetical protein